MIQFHIPVINVLICQSWFTYKKYILVYLQMSGWLWNTFLSYKILVFFVEIFCIILLLFYPWVLGLENVWDTFHVTIEIRLRNPFLILHNLFTDLFVFFCCKSIMVVKINWNKYMVLMIHLGVFVFVYNFNVLRFYPYKEMMLWNKLIQKSLTGLIITCNFISI